MVHPLNYFMVHLFYLVIKQLKRMKMKKEYSAPIVEIVDCECRQIIAASTRQLNVKESAHPEPRGGSWGNIWTNER